MDNCFIEMDTLFHGNPVKTKRPNGRSSSQSFSFRQSKNIYKSLSAADRVLVILIENGGVDLGIPELVEKLLSGINSLIPIPDSAKNALVQFLHDKIKGLTDNLIETAELTLNRYNSAAPDMFSRVVVLRDGTASYNDLKNTLVQLTREGKVMDVMILTHGGTDSISVRGGITGQKIRDIKTAAGRPLTIRSVYMMNCIGSTLNQAWIDAGAKVSSGSIRNNYLPEPTTYFFWNNWKDGQNFETAVTSAYRRTINLMNDAVHAAFSGIPILSSMANNINFESMDFVRDSAPVIQGIRSVTINSDDLTFSQSRSFSSLATTVLPAHLLRSLQTEGEAGVQRVTRRASQSCVDMIKGFEGFRSTKYNDPAGHCTIGYGTLLHSGNCNDTDPSEQPYTNGITEEQAVGLLREKVTEFERTVNESVHVTLNQNQFDSLVSFSFNIGSGAFRSSTLLKILNKGEYAAVPDEMKKWTKGRVNGELVDLPGLVNRRNQEAALFSTPPATAQSRFRAMSAVNYAVPEPYDIIRQPSGNTCWAAVMTMMISWREKQSMSIRNALQMLRNSERYIQMFDNNQLLSQSVAEQLYLDAGLETILSFNPTIEGWENLLRNYGLLYVDIGFENTRNTHAIIVTEIAGDGTATGTYITYIDPAQGRKMPPVRFDQFLRNYEAEGAVNWPYVIVHWPAVQSTSKSLSDYSKPLYDTGEHALVGSFINMAISGPISSVHALQPTTTYTINSVPLTYGQIITMGDFYDSFADLQRASASELRNLKTLITRSENFGQVVPESHRHPYISLMKGREIFFVYSFVWFS